MSSTMLDMVRVITAEAGSDFIYTENGELQGICWDLWKQLAKDLHVTFSTTIYSPDKWLQMFEDFKENKTDIIVQRLDDGQMQSRNITE